MPATKKSAKGTTKTPPTAKGSSAVSTSQCPVCEEKIIDATVSKHGQDSILCEGSCQSWLHRRCAGLTKAEFANISNRPDYKFCCSRCRLGKSESELELLKEKVAALESKLEALLASSLVKAQPASDWQSTKHEELSHEVPSTEPRSVISPQVSKSKSTKVHDRKFNLIIYGIDEHPQGMSKWERLASDVNRAADVLSGLDVTVTTQSIRDCFRLGKFNKDSRPRPLLTKLTRTADVVSILSKRSVLQPPFIIKPDLSPDQRAKEKILLRERWSLIQSGVSRKYIKIRNECLYVNQVLFGKMVGNSFEQSGMNINNDRLYSDTISHARESGIDSHPVFDNQNPNPTTFAPASPANLTPNSVPQTTSLMCPESQPTD